MVKGKANGKRKREEEAAPKKRRKVDDDMDTTADVKKEKKRSSSVKKEKKRSSSVKKEKKRSSSLKEKKRSSSVKKEKKRSSSVKKTKGRKKKEEEEPSFKWWELPETELNEIVNRGPNDPKWKTLVHSGPLMAPPYTPHKIKPVWKGKPVELLPQEEEVLTMYATMQGSDHYDDKVFKKNFWKSFTQVLRKGHILRKAKLEQLDLTAIYHHYLNEKEEKKKMDPEMKKKLKEEKEKETEKYMYCLIDGRKEKVGNFNVEPPGLFRGRGDHPLKGTLKTRVHPEDITINIGDIKDCPKPPEGHEWKEVISNNKVQWLAMWRDNIKGDFKYILLAANSSFKGISDYKKYELARKLKGKVIETVRKDYKKDFNSESEARRQRAVAIYFIDRLALRCGNEKNTNSTADTVGCCSLKCEHVELLSNNVIKLDFLGKDSIRYVNEVEVPAAVFRNVKKFKAKKKKGDKLFDLLTPTTLNKYLKGYMEGLTAKVFRTYNASFTLCNELRKGDETIKNFSQEEKVKFYNDCNRKVAILCNHQKSVHKNFDVSVSKAENALAEEEDHIKRLKKAIKEWDQKGRDTINEQWEKRNKKLTKDYEKECKKVEKELKKIESEAKKNNQSVHIYLAGKAPPKMPSKPKLRKLPSKLEVCKNRLIKCKDSLSKKKIKLLDKLDNKEVSLGTSKINYCDPRISTAWCKRHDVNIEAIFPKALRLKFPWAIGENVPANFIF